jgi:hypothetical protein
MKQRLKALVMALLIITMLSLIAFFSAESGVLANSLKLPPLFADYPIITLAGLIGLLGVLGFALWRLQSSPPEQAQTAAQRNRQRDRATILARASGRVLKELADSLQGAALQKLDLRDQPEAVLALTSASLTHHKVPAKPETSILHAYEEAEHKLLILGEPGAGKSTLLRQLAQNLLTEAQKDGSDMPIPIIFNLASWAITRQPLTEWMVDELRKMYQISRDLGQSWVAADEIPARTPSTPTSRIMG